MRPQSIISPPQVANAKIGFLIPIFCYTKIHPINTVVDPRWTQKNDIAYYGYKNHTKVDAKSKLING